MKWFAASGIVLVSVTHEPLSARPTEARASRLDRLGLDRAAAEAVEPGPAKLADTTGPGPWDLQRHLILLA